MASNLSEKVKAINAMEKQPERKNQREKKKQDTEDIPKNTTPPIILENIDGTPHPVLPDGWQKRWATLVRYIFIGLALVAALTVIDLIRLFRGF